MIYVGVDIGGTKIAAGIVTDDGRILKKDRIQTPASDGGGSVLRASIGLVKSLLSGWEDPIKAIGVGAGGQVDSHRGVIVSATDLLPGWAGQPVGDRFAAELGISTHVENDVNALAVGEFKFGAARSSKTTIFAALGTGVGGALLIDGKLHNGAHWSGGEIGQMIVDISDHARVDGAGHRGTLEAYCSGSALVETYQQITGDRTEISGIQISQDALQDTGGPAALAVSQTGRYLGLGLVSVVSLIDPDLIVIGGGLAELGDLLLNPSRIVLHERALPGPAACPIITASMGTASSILGAAAVAMVKSE